MLAWRTTCNKVVPASLVRRWLILGQKDRMSLEHSVLLLESVLREWCRQDERIQCLERLLRTESKMTTI